MQQIIDAYIATWNSARDDRQALLERHFSADLSYCDPLSQVGGRGGIDALIDSTQSQFPDFVFTPLGDPDGHHDQVRFRWGLGPEGAEPVIIGFDVIVVDDDGRIEDVRGFLDRVPDSA